MTQYETLIHKSENALRCSMNAKSRWAKKYWKIISEKLMEQAMNLPVIHAIQR